MITAGSMRKNKKQENTTTLPWGVVATFSENFQDDNVDIGGKRQFRLSLKALEIYLCIIFIIIYFYSLSPEGTLLQV